MTLWIRFYGLFIQFGKLYMKKRTGILLSKHDSFIRIKPAIRGYFISIHIPFKRLRIEK